MLYKVKNSAFKANIAALASKVVSVIGPLITVPLFIKYLTIEEYGIWLMVLSVTSFFYLSNVGILQVVTNAVAKDISEKKIDHYSQIASSDHQRPLEFGINNDFVVKRAFLKLFR